MKVDLGKVAAGGLLGLGAGAVAVAKNQIEMDAKERFALAESLRGADAAEKVQKFTAGENQKTRDLTASEGLANRTSKTEDLQTELAAKEKISDQLIDLKATMASEKNDRMKEQIQAKINAATESLKMQEKIIDMKISLGQGLLGIRQQQADTADRKVDAGKQSSPTEQAKARSAAITEAQGYIDSGDTRTAQTILSSYGLKLQEEVVPGEKNWIMPNGKDTKKYHIVEAVSGKNGLVGSAAGPTAGAVGTQAAPVAGKSEYDAILKEERSAIGGQAIPAQKPAVKSVGVIGTEKTQTPVISDDLPATLNDLDSMVKNLPEETDGIYKKTPTWERDRNIPEKISAITGQSQATQSPELSRKGENDLTKAIRIATGKTDIYELNIIADKLQTIYKGKLSDAQLANLIKEGKLLGNKTGA